jgi:hypothetical protein
VSLAFTIAGARSAISCILGIYFRRRFLVRLQAQANFEDSALMDISSVSAPASAAPINPVDTGAPKTTSTTAADGSDTNATHQPPPPPPLPPGQGTRVDQLA